MGTEENRCYYIPYDLNGRERKRLLNGIWKFQYFDNVYAGKVFRAPIDNDKNIIKEWEKAGYDRAVARVYETTAVYGEKLFGT